MAQDAGLNSLLKWSIENSDTSGQDSTTVGAPRSQLNEQALRELMGGPSDADLMRDSMSVAINEQADIEARLTAFDNFEQLVENIDNANNMEPMGLWTPLLSQLKSSTADIRRMAAWCIGTAVQNNVKAQERLLAVNGIPMLCEMALGDPDPAAKRKAVYALSSSTRNYQPGLNEAVKCLPDDITGSGSIGAGDMDAIDAIMTKLREQR